MTSWHIHESTVHQSTFPVGHKQHLYFVHNDVNKGINTRIKEAQENSSIQDGNIKLDFEKYNYLFALSSVRCGCQEENNGGFQFSVSVEKLCN